MEEEYVPCMEIEKEKQCRMINEIVLKYSSEGYCSKCWQGNITDGTKCIGYHKDMYRGKNLMGQCVSKKFEKKMFIKKWRTEKNKKCPKIQKTRY